MTEPSIVINGVPLTTGQALTLRVALGEFMILVNEWLAPDDAAALAGEETIIPGDALYRGYRDRAREIAHLMGLQK